MMPQISLPKMKKRIKGKTAPWLSAGIKKEMNQRDKLLRKWRKDQRSITKNAYKVKRNLVHLLVINAKSNYTRSLLQQNSNDTTLFWKALKRVYPSKNKTYHAEISFDVDGRKVSNPKSVVQGFCKYLRSAVNKLKIKE